MNKNKSLNHNVGRRSDDKFDDPKIANVRRELSSSGVLDSLESCLEFLELLKEKNVDYNAPLWIVADNAYRIHLIAELTKKRNVDSFAYRYSKLFRVPEKHHVTRAKEDFPGEYN